jgi:mannose-binding lectin 2
MLRQALSALWLAATALGAGGPPGTEDNIRSINLRTHSLKQPYLDADVSNRWYEFGGDTIIRTDSYIRLTGDRQSQEGWLFSRVPITATNYEITVEFKIHGSNQLYGDGFAMWLTKQRGQPGPVFGHTDNFDGLGIFIDTYKNNRPGVVFPYVMAMMGDGKTSYNKNNDGKDTEMAGCSARGLRHAGVPTKLRLTYFQEKSLKLELQYKAEDEWTLCFETNEPPSIPSVSYLGFSAETGELHDNHDIISIEAKNMYMGPSAKTTGSGKGKKAAKNFQSGGGGSWLGFLFKIMLVAMVLGLAYVGFTVYRSNKSSRSHRF